MPTHYPTKEKERENHWNDSGLLLTKLAAGVAAQRHSEAVTDERVQANQREVIGNTKKTNIKPLFGDTY